ncbi:MAG: DUF2142 domain-containing protein [Gemmiger sp.]
MSKSKPTQKTIFGKRPGCTLLAGAVCFVVCLLVWLTAVRGQGGKGLSQELSGDYTAATAPIETSVSQTFSFDGDLISMAFVFVVNGEQPTGAIHLSLTDADTGEELAWSDGEMGNILSGQYTGMGLNRKVEGRAGRRYCVTLTPAYAGSGRLAVGCSAEATLWNDTLTVDGEAQRGTMALMVIYRQIGGFLTRFYWAVALAACLAVMAGVWLAMGKNLPLHRVLFVLVLVFGLLWSVVLPPYSAPDEQYHINQSFTLACKWANRFSDEDWTMGHVPLDSSYRRACDANDLLQNERTTVFTWQEAAGNLLTRTDEPFDSHRLFEEAQADNNPTLYLPSAAVVFLCFVLRLGFVPTLYLGRLVNLVLFALLAALAVKMAPFGRRIFFAAALLPMTLHLAASFSRDSLLLGLCFAFTALVLWAAAGEGPLLTRRNLLPLAALAVFGLLLAPAKLVYLPLAALVLLIPAVRLGGRGRAAGLKAGYLAACLLLTLAVNRTVVSTAAGQQTETAPEAAAQAETLSAPDIAPVLLSAQDEAAPRTGTSSYLPELDDASAAALAEPTAEGFVRRLFYYGEGRLDESDNEVAFWADALERGYVGGALLGQSFFFGVDSPEYTDEQRISGICLAFTGTDPVADGTAERYLEITATGQYELLYKTIYSGDAARAAAETAGYEIGCDDIDRFPLDRNELYAEVRAAIDVDERKSVATDEDAVCFTPAYILTHLPRTVTLLVNSVIQYADHYLRGLVGGLLSYNSLELAWGWVLALYALLALAALPAGELPQDGAAPRRLRIGLGLGALCCCALVVVGCLTWTPIHYTALYGLQGRYFLPALPCLLLALAPAGMRLAGPTARTPERPLIVGLAAVNGGMLLNAMLAIIAR